MATTEKWAKLFKSRHQYADSVPVQFGNAKDAAFNWDGTNLQLLPVADDTGAFNIGDGTTDMDVKIFMNTSAKYVLFDQSLSAVTFVATTLTLGADTTGTDFKLFGATTGNYLLWDASEDDLTLVGTATQLAVAGTTESTSTTTGSLRTAGGLACVGDFYAGDDLFLTSGAVINFNAGNVTITHAANKLSFAGATAAGVNGYSFDMAVGTIASEAHGVDVTTTGTLASSKSLVGLNVKATAAGTAGAWLAGLFINATQASKMVNGYLCAAEFELTSTAAGASDNSVIVLNSVRNHTGSAPACDPYITLREYGTTYANVFLRVFGDTGQGTIAGFNVGTLVTEVQDGYEAGCRVAIRCMVGSTPIWLLANETAPTS